MMCGRGPTRYRGSFAIISSTSEKSGQLEKTYESEASFNRAFRREYGLPPGRYRRAAVT